nr:hypothetical protein [uncultured Agathobaculum sp.]
MSNIYIGENGIRTATKTEENKNIFPAVTSVATIILVGAVVSLYGADGSNMNIIPNNCVIEERASNYTYLIPEIYMATQQIPTYNEDISKLEMNSLNIGQRPTQDENRAALAEMYDLDPDWFDPIDRDLLAKTEGLIYALNVQPEIFPVPNGHIQFEYDTEDGRYMELELFPDKKVRMMVTQTASKPIHDVFGLDVNKINRVVEMFYDGRF